jgi:hypothetical protein
MHPNQTIQLTPKAFASRHAGHCDDQLEFMKHIVDLPCLIRGSIPLAGELCLVRCYLVP